MSNIKGPQPEPDNLSVEKGLVHVNFVGKMAPYSLKKMACLSNQGWLNSPFYLVLSDASSRFPMVL